jgi:hypothetical protein
VSAFHLGDLLSITDGHLVAPSHMDGIYRLLNHMTGDNLFTHQLPRAADECKPELLRQHPFLAGIVAPEFRDVTHVELWLAEQCERHGTWFEVKPLDPGDHTHIDPLTEIAMIAPHMKVIPVVVDGQP